MEDVLIIAIIFGAIFGGRIVKLILDHRKELKELEISESSKLSQNEQDRLNLKIDELKQRVEVLEKIVTDSKYHIDKEIASL
ncbi:nitrite reductase [Vibrio atypicus]|uniref:nitrite reductase n=1 Tax=Vibrio atypicus TaxID=558271 RepID=UPI00135C955A|nr:nitrite reductase [Vibrio atypicus]